MDNQYYRKNAQLRYQLSKELDIYKQKIENLEKHKSNPFVIPLFSTIISIAVAIAGFFAHEHGICAFILPSFLIIVFVITYTLTNRVLFPIYEWLKNEIKQLKPINKEFYRNLTDAEKKKLLAKFDFDITGLIHLSYVIATDVIEDDLLNEYNRGEALFYIDRSLKKLQNVFVDYAQYTPNIYDYRIKNNMDLLGAAIISLSKFNKSNPNSLEIHIHNAISLFNIVGKSINEKYSKQIVTLIELK